MPTLPTPFKRGQTFSYLTKIPTTVEDGFLAPWLPRAQIRKARNSSNDGLIAEINCFWADDKNRYLSLYHNDTHAWPVGEAEMDVLFANADGQLIYSTTILLRIERGITQ